jgi:hypothetical protein
MQSTAPPTSKQASNSSFIAAAWGLSLTVSIIAVAAWGQDYDWQVIPVNAYQLFPLLGILAFSLMWAHYVVAVARELLGVDAKSLGSYFQYTGYGVLVLICLHPGLLILQRFRDGYGLPPGSYESYVAPGLGWITLLCTVSLFVFIAYEFHRKFGKRSWWHYVQEAGDIAMLAIFYHGLRLGGQLSSGSWFRTVWIFYGLVLIAVLLRSYANKYLIKQKLHKKTRV